MENILKDIHTELVRIRKLMTYQELRRIDNNEKLNLAQKKTQKELLLISVLDLADQKKWNDILKELG